MNAIRAAIEAAYIEGFLGIFGCIFLLGILLCILFFFILIRFNAKNDAKKIKLENVVKFKRDQYIELANVCVRLIASSKGLRKIDSLSASNKKEEYWGSHQDKYLDLCGCINKVSLITTSEIRLKLFNFEKEINNYQNEIFQYYFDQAEKPTSKELEEEFFQLMKCLRIDLGILNDDTNEANLQELRKI